MTNSIFLSFGRSRGERAKSSTALYPGGWGDRIVFGYMFRVISAVAAVILPACLVSVWAFFNHWQMTHAMLIFFGGMVAITIAIGEAMRVGVYESRISAKRKSASIDQYTEMTPDFIEIYGSPKRGYLIAKRAIDLVVSFSVLIVIMPIFIVAALMVKFDSPGPAYVVSNRVGFKGRNFKLFRFRTTHGRDTTGAPVITRAGRFLRATSVDELPQILNVVLGDMSIVGPRPIRIDNIIHRKRASKEAGVKTSILYYAKPGITGIPSKNASGRDAAVAYLIDRSIWHDFLIVISTMKAMLSGEAF